MVCVKFSYSSCVSLSLPTLVYKKTYSYFNSLYQQFLWLFFCLKFCYWSSPSKASSGLSSALSHPWHFTGLTPAWLGQYCTGEPRTGPSIPDTSHWDWAEGKDHLPPSPDNALLVTRAFLGFLLIKKTKSKTTKTHTHPKQTTKETNKQKPYPFFDRSLRNMTVYATIRSNNSQIAMECRHSMQI